MFMCWNTLKWFLNHSEATFQKYWCSNWVPPLVTRAEHWPNGPSGHNVPIVNTLLRFPVHCSQSICSLLQSHGTENNFPSRENKTVFKTETSSCVRCIVYCVPRVLTLWTQYVWTGHRHVLVKQAGYIGSSLFSMKTAQNWTKKTDLRMLDTLILPVSAAAPILSCCHTLYTRDH